MKKYLLFVIILGVWSLVHTVQARTPSPKGASVYIISPHSGEKVKSPVLVQFGLKGMGVAPAGVAKENTGHHHLIIDEKKLPPLSKPVPSDEHHRHFGGGQTEVELELKPGKHTLQLLMADQNHIPLDPVVSSPVVEIEVIP